MLSVRAFANGPHNRFIRTDTVLNSVVILEFKENYLSTLSATLSTMCHEFLNPMLKLTSISRYVTQVPWLQKTPFLRSFVCKLSVMMTHRLWWAHLQRWVVLRVVRVPTVNRQSHVILLLRVVRVPTVNRQSHVILRSDHATEIRGLPKRRAISRALRQSSP